MVADLSPNFVFFVGVQEVHPRRRAISLRKHKHPVHLQLGIFRFKLRALAPCTVLGPWVRTWEDMNTMARASNRMAVTVSCLYELAAKYHFKPTMYCLTCDPTKVVDQAHDVENVSKRAEDTQHTSSLVLNFVSP